MDFFFKSSSDNFVIDVSKAITENINPLDTARSMKRDMQEAAKLMSNTKDKFEPYVVTKDELKRQQISSSVQNSEPEVGSKIDLKGKADIEQPYANPNGRQNGTPDIDLG